MKMINRIIAFLFFMLLCSVATAQTSDIYQPILDTFITAFSARDASALQKVYQSQYFFIGENGEVITIDEKNPHEPLFRSLGFENYAYQKAILEDAKVVQKSDKKIHLAAFITLFDKKGDRMGSEPVMFILNKIDEKWAMAGISLIKPLSGSNSRGLKSNHTVSRLTPESQSEIMRVLNDFMTTFNARDPEKHSDTHHFPHFRLTKDAIKVQSRDDYYVNKIPFFFSIFKATTLFKWDHSKWNDLKIVQASEEKAHVVTQFSRCKSDGSCFATIDSLYVLTKKDGKWGILGRSSFAPL